MASSTSGCNDINIHDMANYSVVELQSPLAYQQKEELH